uniref:Receptor-like serine/threonine-protein kinase n=1 Tax=Oryza meridionalis TaxID=40149 RepID=A0A0E0DC69_9ORYZ
MCPANPFVYFMVLVFVVLAVAAPSVCGQRSDYPTANLSTLWVNNKVILPHSISYTDGSSVRTIVLRSPQNLYGPSFAAGFFCTPPCQAFLFTVFIVYTNSGAGITLPVNGMAQVIWSANRANPVGENATLELTGDGNLVLREANGKLVWSSSTSGRSMAWRSLSRVLLVLFDQKNKTVWQSFDHPTDALVPGQSLLQGMRLRANTSTTNWTESKLYMTVLSDGLYGYVESTPPQLYYESTVSTNRSGKDLTRITFTNGSLSIFAQSIQAGEPDGSIALPKAKSTQYIRLESDGHLRLYEWSDAEVKWTMVSDVIKIFPDDCAFPTVCGEYGICTGGQCMCPAQSNSSPSYFQPVDKRKANLGCAPVQIIPSSAPTQNKSYKTNEILGSTLAAIITLVLVVIIASYVRRRKYQELDKELDFDILPGMPVRFSFEKLRQCTEDFSKKLGEGGFGSVFEGKIDEERVAVKRLEGARQGKKEFLAEVETIGSIEHINLVRLIGFCAEKSHRLLKIAHLDIKPQNILLDENFNAKLADFGLSKLIDRDQSNVMTVMRGTPGYLAPEWLTSPITEKVDIYSFGVVLMEIISGRKNIDISQPEESVQLLNLLREKAQNNRLIDMIDKHSNDMVSHEEEVIQMMKLTIWCLQNDSSRRPSMSMVVKVLEGAMSVENCIDYGFFNASSVISVQDNPSSYSAPPPASILSEEYFLGKTND